MEKIKEKKDAMKVATGFIAGITAVKLATMSCLVFTVCVIVSILIIAFIAISKINGDKFTRRGIVALIVAIVTLLCVGCYHRYFCHDMVETPEVVAEENTEVSEEEPEVPEEETTEVTEEVSSYKARPEMGYCPEDEKVSDETTNTRKNAEEQVQKETDEPAHITGENNEAYKAEIDEAVEEAKENNANIGSIDVEGTDVTTVVETKPQEEPERTEEKAELDKDEAVEIKNEGESPSTNIEAEEKVEDVEASDDKTLDDMLEESTTEITEDTTSETTEETTEVVTTPANGNVSIEEVTEVENDSNVIDVEESVELPEVEKVSVEPIDGYDTVVGSQIQFKINGDDVVIDGLDGINYQFNNGILTVDAGDCATVITVTVSNEVNSISFDINVNGIVG